MNTLRLDWCSHEAAKYAVERWYSRPDMPVGKLAKIGVWEDGIFIGALIFGCGTGGVQKIGEKLGAGKFGTAELSRIAMGKHSASVSRIIRIALMLLTRAQPGLRLIVTYADPSAGHHGGVYQAGGWIYCGKSSKDFMYRDAAGVEHHSRQASASGTKMSRGKLTHVIKTGDCVKIPLEPKHRYLMPLDADMRAKVELLRQPNPKQCVRSIPAETAAVQAEEGGPAPTRTLHPSLR